MKVLIACEFSGTVRDAFRDKGHDAWSCDLLPGEGKYTAYHFAWDIFELLKLDPNWDLMIAHPPCTYLTIAGAAYYKQNSKCRQEAINFFKALQVANINKIAIENPIPFNSVTKEVGKYNQIINPFQFGQPFRKKTCLWLKNLPKLIPTNIVPLPEPKYCIRKSGKKAGKKYNYYFHQGKSGHERSRFFTGIANAMVEQWGNPQPTKIQNQGEK